MKIQQLQFSSGAWRTTQSSRGFDPQQCQLLLIFGESGLLQDETVHAFLIKEYPTADLVYSSTSGEILDEYVSDNTIAVTCIQFEKTRIRTVETNISAHTGSSAAAQFLMQHLSDPELQSVFIISDGTSINGSELVEGFNAVNPKQIPVTGGLAGDAARFQKTFTGLNKIPGQGNVIAIGFYGNHLQVGHGSFGGWDAFGHTRKITRSDKNVLYEIDGKNALDLYKEYLGPFKDELPGSALLFPLTLKETGEEGSVVRTILGVSEEHQSMTFAGNMPEGSEVRMMKANFDKLIDASSIAAKHTFSPMQEEPDLAILISCVGRKLILMERTEEEVQAAKAIFGNDTFITGFYSYGEISPLLRSSRCDLHNQTMTITTFKELS